LRNGAAIGRGPSPPDFEELLRLSQDKLGTVLPGGAVDAVWC
jgi:hypothetical protein